MSTWNYRVATKFTKYEKEIAEKLNQEGYRTFSIVECYYNKENIPDGCGEPNTLCGWENFEDLEGTYELIKKAFKKPILDLDNFPEIYNQEKV